MRNRDAQRPMLCVLNALSGDPATFESFLHHLALEDLEQAWLLSFDLAHQDDINKNRCADLLGLWCTGRLLASIRATDRDS